MAVHNAVQEHLVDVRKHRSHRRGVRRPGHTVRFHASRCVALLAGERSLDILGRLRNAATLTEQQSEHI